MHDRKITLELYPETKRIVDKIILDEDYELSDTPYFDPDITMLEVLRIYFSFVVAKKYKKQKTEKQLLSMIDPEGIQEWLIWIHNNKNKEETSFSCEQYQGKQPVPIFKNIGVYKNGAFVESNRNILYYNKSNKTFQEHPCKIDGEILQKICEEIEISALSSNVSGIKVPSPYEIAESYVDKAHAHQNSKASLEIDFDGNGGAMLLHYEPFSFNRATLSRIVQIHAEESKKLQDVRNKIQSILIKSKWPNDNYKLLFHVKGSLYEDDGAYGKEIRATIILKYNGLDHNLNPRKIEIYLGCFTYKREWDNQRISEEFERISYTTKLKDNIKKTSDIESEKLKRRIRKLEEIGEGHLKIDEVSQYLLDIVLRHDPDKYKQIIQNKTVKVKLPIESLRGFIKGRSTKGDSTLISRYETITFKIEEGNLRSVFHINDDYYWNKNRLRVGRYPDSILKSLPGKKAKDVVDHPIAGLLGEVVRAYPFKDCYSWITFDLKCNSVNISEMQG